MLYLDGYKETIKSIYKMSRNDSVGTISSLGDLKGQYLRFLKQNSTIPVNFSEDVFIHTEEEEDQYAKAYFGETEIDDLDQSLIIGDSFSPGDREKRIKILREQLERSFSVNKELADLFQTAIHTIFIKKTNAVHPKNGKKLKAFGGSSSNSVGTIWISTNKPLSQRDATELFVHELTHNLMFIDEFTMPHYKYGEIADPKNYALSAIRGTMRPLDKVVHSIIVAAEILSAREDFIDETWPENGTLHPMTPKLISDTLASIDTVEKLPNLSGLLEERSYELVQKAKKIIKNI